MSTAVYERTPNLGLGLIEFAFPNWADDANLNMQILDSAMAVIGVSIKGSWQNNTTYNQGDLVVDPDVGGLWRATLNHISAAEGSMTEERTTNPTYWDDASGTVHARGQWMPDTSYYANDIVYNGYVWAIATQQHVSTTFDQDIADGKLIVITDQTAAVEDSEAAATVAMASASQASASATNAGNSATSANNAASAAANSSASAASSAASADSSEADAELAADRAELALSKMLPDAPVDSKYYARYNETWQAVIGEAPNDGICYGRKSLNWVPATGAMIVSDSPPVAPLANGQLWFESDSGNTFMWYVDADSSQWIHISGFSTLIPGGGGGIAEAPADGNTYARRNTAWINMGGAVPVNEAPMDGKQYARKNGAWVEVNIPVVTYPMVFDVNGDAVIKFGSSIVVRVKPSGLILTKDDVEVFSTSV